MPDFQQLCDEPAGAPSSMTCSLDVSVPLLNVFCAKEMTVLGAARPGTFTVENAAACASSACDRF